MSNKARDPFPDDDDYEAWRYDDNLPVPDLDAPGSQHRRITARRRAAEALAQSGADHEAKPAEEPPAYNLILPSAEEFRKMLAEAEAQLAYLK